MPSIYTVVLTYLDGQEIEIAEGTDRAAMHDLARRVAGNAAPEVDSVAVVVGLGETEPTLTWSNLHDDCVEHDANRPSRRAIELVRRLS